MRVTVYLFGLSKLQIIDAQPMTIERLQSIDVKTFLCFFYINV